MEHPIIYTNKRGMIARLYLSGECFIRTADNYPLQWVQDMTPARLREWGYGT